jgi:hypothetical protein
MKHFIVYLLTWISQNLSIPFWMVGHVHLTMNIYQDIYEILMSFGMNIIVAIGFYLDYKKYKNEQTTTPQILILILRTQHQLPHLKVTKYLLKV